MILQTTGISKSYSKKKNSRMITVLDSTDIELRSGELTVIVGRSGSGKTTLLNILAGLLRPSEGSVLYDGMDIYGCSDKELSAFRAEHTGYIPQSQSILHDLDVKNNILLPSALIGKDESANARRLMDELGIASLENSYPDELSGGELRRTAVARALINEPSFIFADEPTNDLDAKNSSLVFGLLKKKAEEGAAVIVVTHEQSAAEYADNVYQMESGRLRSL